MTQKRSPLSNEDIIERLMQSADGVARLHGYPYTDRQRQWRARFEQNRPEVEYIAGLTEIDSSQYRHPEAIFHPAGVNPGRSQPGIASQAARPGQQIDALAQQALANAQKLAQLNTFTLLATPAEIAEQARQACQTMRRGHYKPLLGVPVAVKDIMAVKGFRTTCGSGMPEQPINQTDATAIGRLRQAGALFVGMANLHELAYGINSENPHFGAVVNPQNPDHTPGGSSGGCAVAVAAGILRATVASDTSGSIRIPAACCGVVGFKPSYDAIPRDGAMNLGPSVDHIGPITRSVDDAALLFAIMADQPAQVPDKLHSLHGLSIGLPQRHFFDLLAPDVEHAVKQAIAQLKADGAQIIELDIPGVEHSPAIQFSTLCSEATAIHWPRLLQPQTLGEDVRVRLEVGQFLPAIWYARAQAARTQLVANMNQALERVDFLLTPTMRSTAPRSGADGINIHGQRIPLHTAVTSLTLPFNLSGMPAISLPCGTGENNLPVGLQLVGRYADDWRLLALAKRVESLLPAQTPVE